jgi:hypothetical protein
MKHCYRQRAAEIKTVSETSVAVVSGEVEQCRTGVGQQHQRDVAIAVDTMRHCNGRRPRSRQVCDSDGCRSGGLRPIPMLSMRADGLIL